MATQSNLDKAYMACARAVAALSKAERKKVGAILVSSQGSIIAEGFNGTPSGFDNACEETKFYVGEYEYNDVVIRDADGRQVPVDIRRVTKSEVVHAEANAIAKVARSTNSSAGATLYCTLSPCFECAKQIIQAGIVRVVFAEQYPYAEHTGILRAPGLDLLRKAKIQVEQLNEVA